MNRIIIVALSLLLALAVSACGGDSTSTEGNPATAPAQTDETDALKERIAELEAEDRREAREARRAKREKRRREREKQAAAAEPEPEPEP